MRSLAIAFLFNLIFVTVLIGQENCKAFFPFEEGAVMEYTNYDKKDKMVGKATHTVASLETLSEGGIEAEVKTELVDKKGKEMYDGSYTVKCEGNKYYMDMSNLLPAEMMQSTGQMNAEVTGEGLVIPSDIEVGQTLPDASTQINLASGGLGNLMNMRMEVINRKVEAKETVETPAGTFECYKITQETVVKTIMKKTFQSAEWYAMDVGLVRSESYDKKGRLDSYMVLTKLEK